MKKWSVVFVLTVAAALGAATAAAQDNPDYVPDGVEASAEGRKAGWHPMLKASFTLAFNDNKNVVGVDEGSSYNTGLIINGGLDYLSEGGHLWANALKWQLNYTQTPIIDKFYKSLDLFDFNSAYLYKLPSIKWLGPYASFVLKTSIFPGDTIKAVDTDVTRVDLDGTEAVEAQVKAKSDIRLTDAFAPATLRESAGMFADILSRRSVELQARAGAGLWETYVKDGYSVAEDEPGVLKLQRMQDSVQAGGEVQLNGKGVLRQHVNWGFKAEMMYPFYHNADTDLEGSDLINYELEGLIGMKMAEWASLDYSLKAYKYPLIVDDWQISNALLLTLTAGIL